MSYRYSKHSYRSSQSFYCFFSFFYLLGWSHGGSSSSYPRNNILLLDFLIPDVKVLIWVHDNFLGLMSDHSSLPPVALSTFTSKPDFGPLHIQPALHVQVCQGRRWGGSSRISASWGSQCWAGDDDILVLVSRTVRNNCDKVTCLVSVRKKDASKYYYGT